MPYYGYGNGCWVCDQCYYAMVDESEVDDDEYTHYSYGEIAWEAQDNDWDTLY
jgi:hypothetical protein